jgi:hypothetical protein
MSGFCIVFIVMTLVATLLWASKKVLYVSDLTEDLAAYASILILMNRHSDFSTALLFGIALIVCYHNSDAKVMR